MPDELKARDCGAVHPQGVVCVRQIWVEPGCCHEKVYNHEGCHYHRDKNGQITHMWEAVLTVKDLPHNAYLDPEKTA